MVNDSRSKKYCQYHISYFFFPCFLTVLFQGLTFDGRATDQVCVGEVERSLQLEVGLQHLPHLLAEVGIQTDALQRNLPLLAELQQ